MIEWRRIVSSGTTLAAVALTWAMLGATPARAQTPSVPVRITNTPVPVAVQGTPSVLVGNTLAAPIPTRCVNEPARQPVQRTELLIFAAGDTIKDQTLYTVPAGKRLVIEEASVRAQLFDGVSQAMVFIRSFADGNIGGHYVPLQPVGPVDGMGTVLVGTELLGAYADAGTTVDASITLNTGTGDGGRFEVTISGHLVDL